ncbi:hypothetical protein BOTCAL_0036g00370 [Botryotinia calthae]|uniref:Uncharacterized protein n=1 Tax=Botryotinia calthae TaxID=38488 RepID=A0A4Y8DEY8_9HELO|nr:hypothetical protein BOTCAL_0036g00370 [Botryotinia calthae]
MADKHPYDASASSKTTSQSFTSSYPESQSPSTLNSSDVVHRFLQQPQPSFIVDGNPYLFPSIFGLYKDGMRRLCLSEHHVSTPFMTVAVHSGWSGEPSIILSSPTAVMGTAELHTFSSKIDLVIGNTSSTIQSSGYFSPVYDFTYTFDDGRQEVFQWKKSSGDAVAGLGGRSRGYKLVRASNGEVLAAWTHPGGPSIDKMAKFGLLDSMRKLGWGERWEVTLVLSAIALVEKERRARNNAVAAA